MKKEQQNVINNKVILNLIQDLQRLPLWLINDRRGRCQIKFGMTVLYNNGGFTLIELLVVVLIIGILAAVAVPQYRLAVGRSQYATVKNLVDSIAKAEEVYYLAHGRYTENFEELDISMPGGKLDTSTTQRYNYDWGDCWIVMNEYSLVTCRESKNNVAYRISLKHSPQLPNVRACLIFNTTEIDWRAKICELETNTKTTQSNINTVNNQIRWAY